MTKRFRENCDIRIAMSLTSWFYSLFFF